MLHYDFSGWIKETHHAIAACYNMNLERALVLGILINKIMV